MKRSLRILGVAACGMTLAALFAVVIWQQSCIGRLRAEAEVHRGQVARAPSFREQRGKTATIQFQEIPIDQHFEFRGRRYKKLALIMASDEERNGTIFQAQTEVLPDPFSHTGPTLEPIGRPKPSQST